MVEEGGTPGASASWPASPTVTGYRTHGLMASSPGPSLERSVDHKPKWVLHPPGSQRVWTCPTVGPRPGAVTHGQAMTSTMLQLGWAGLGWAPTPGRNIGAPTPERGWLRRLQWEGRGFQEGTQGPWVDEAAKTLMNSGHQ